MKNITFSRSINEGQIFELGFKLGAMYVFESRKRFRKIIGEKRRDIERELQTISDNTYSHEIYNLVNDNVVANILQDLQDKSDIKRIAFNLSVYYGQLFAKEVVETPRKRKQNPKCQQRSRFQIIAFDARNAGANKDRYFNADIMLLEHMTKKENNSKIYHLYAYEIKIKGYRKTITKMLNDRSNLFTLIQPCSRHMYFTSHYNDGQDYFKNFFDNIITSTTDNISFTHTISREYLAQVCSYIFDFLRKEKEIAKQVKAISFGIISAFHNYPIYHFYFDDISKIDIDGYAEKFTSLYLNKPEEQEKCNKESHYNIINQ